jgi:hypothetical protein
MKKFLTSKIFRFDRFFFFKETLNHLTFLKYYKFLLHLWSFFFYLWKCIHHFSSLSHRQKKAEAMIIIGNFCHLRFYFEDQTKRRDLWIYTKWQRGERLSHQALPMQISAPHSTGESCVTSLAPICSLWSKRLALVYSGLLVPAPERYQS